MPIFKRCSRCNQRIPEGTKCACVSKRYREEDRYKTDTRERKFYSSGDWQAKQATAKQYFIGIDIYSYYVLDCVETGQTVHHIIPIQDDWSKRFDDDNLIYLTERNHQRLHALMRKSQRDYDKVVAQLQLLRARFMAEFKQAGGYV